MDSVTLFTALNLVMLIISTWLAFKRGSFQNTVDDSQAALNYKKLVIELQAEVKEMKDMLDNAHLEVKLEVQIGEAPIVKEWKWKKRIEEIEGAPV